MKKSALRSLIRECVQEVITEAMLLKKFQDFTNASVPENIRDDFITTLYPFFHKTAERKQDQLAYVLKMIAAAIGQQMSPADIAYFQNHDIDLSDKAVRAKLSHFHSFLSKFKDYIEETP
jgi:hypothetical protein